MTKKRVPATPRARAPAAVALKAQFEPIKAKTAFPTLERLVALGGTVTLAGIAPGLHVAVAADPAVVWVSLKRRTGEPLPDLLLRLDRAMEGCYDSGMRIDELSALRP